MTWFAIPTELRRQLLDNTVISETVDTRVHYQEVPQTSNFPHVWFSRNSIDTPEETLADDTDNLKVERYALEIVSDTDVESLIDAIVSVVEAFRGEVVPGRYVQLTQVEDADDDYQYQSIGEADPKFLHALDLAVYVLPLT